MIKASKVKEEATKSSSAAMDYINSLEGKGWDFDGYYGWQCFDLVNYYWNYLYGHGFMVTTKIYLLKMTLQVRQLFIKTRHLCG